MIKIAAINRTFPEQEYVRNGNSLAFAPQGRDKTPDNTRAIGPRQSGYLQVLQYISLVGHDNVGLPYILEFSVSEATL